MPEVIVIDEIGTELEALAARTIAERGVQLVGTAHGNTLDNLILNPTLSDLIGGIQTVTLGDEEARRRHTQKSILERKAPPTFDVVVEIQDFEMVAIHPDVAQAVDSVLQGHPPVPEIRWLDEEGVVRSGKAPFTVKHIAPAKRDINKESIACPEPAEGMKIYPFGINRSKLEQAAAEMQLSVSMVDKLEEADILATTRNYYRRKPQKVRDAEAVDVPVYAIKSNTISHMKRFLETICISGDKKEILRLALRETEQGIDEVLNGRQMVELAPQGADIRRLQHLMAERHHLMSNGIGSEPQRKVRIFKGNK
jgi:hypothetical protein